MGGGPHQLTKIIVRDLLSKVGNAFICSIFEKIVKNWSCIIVVNLDLIMFIYNFFSGRGVDSKNGWKLVCRHSWTCQAGNRLLAAACVIPSYGLKGSPGFIFKNVVFQNRGQNQTVFRYFVFLLAECR